MSKVKESEPCLAVVVKANIAWWTTNFITLDTTPTEGELANNTMTTAESMFYLREQSESSFHINSNAS